MSSLPAPRFIGTLEWAERNLRVGDGAFRAADFPWLGPIAREVDRRRGCTFGLMFPPQVFKTLFLQMRALRNIAVEPGRQLFYCLNGKDAADLADEKLCPLRDSVPAVMAHFPHDPDARGGKQIWKAIDAPFSLLGAENRNHRNSRSGRTIYLDEPWQFEPGWIPEIIARSDSYQWQRQIILATTAPSVDDEVDVLWRTSSQMNWHVVCLHCRERVPLEFGEPDSPGGIKWDSDEHTREPDGSWKIEVAKLTARWHCPACHQVTLYDPKTLRELNDPARGAGYVQGNPAPDPQVHFWRGNAFLMRDWRQLVGEWLAACNAKRRGSLEATEDFYRKKRVESWDPMKVTRRTNDLPVGDYDLGDPWADEGKMADGAPMRFLWVDVQRDHFWAVARQWSPNAQSRLLHFERLWEGSQIEALRNRLGIPPNHVVLDEAYNADLVHQICTAYHILCANGVSARAFPHHDGVRRIFGEPRTIDPFLGRSNQGMQWCVGFHYASEGAKDRLDTLRQARSADGKPLWTIARNAPSEYVEQAYAEAKIRKRHPKNNGWFYEWKKLRPDNHAFDMECGQVISASMCGLLTATSTAESEE
jgi:hypothetical protein